MKSKIKKSKISERLKAGFVSAYALVAFAVAITIISGLLVFVSNVMRQSSNEVSYQQALQVAESGVYFYQWYLAHNLDGKNAQQIKDFWQNGNPYGVSTPYAQDVKDFSGTPFGRYSVTVEPPDPDSTIVMVTSTGWTFKHPSIQRSVRLRLRRPSWSEYSVLANDVMRFGDGTEVYGPIHSNNGIRFDGIAHNIVTSAVTTYRDPDSGITRPGVWTSKSNESQVFLAGKKFPEPLVDFNSVISDFSYMRDEAQSGGLYFGGDTYEKEINCRYRWIDSRWRWRCDIAEFPVKGYHIILRTDDTIEVRKVTDYGGDIDDETETYSITEEISMGTYPLPANGLIYVNNNAWIEGQIDTANVTIAAADLDTSEDKDIYINNDIKYTNKDGRDVLGLIAENNISVGLYSEDNLEIDAALLAQKGRVGRNYYYSSSYRWRDTITVFGAIATNQRYGFAYVDGTGYDTRNLYFDNSLLYTPPPYFPTGTQYQIDLWEDL